MKIEEAEKREQTRQKSDEEDRLRKEKEQMVEKKQTLAHEEESLNTQEKVATDAINQADELLNDATVEPLTNDHPHQRPSLSYDHISCDGQWFLFVYESLTSDHPSYTTTPM